MAKRDFEFQPGEYELLTETAAWGWWDNGKLIITNHRLIWIPQRTSNAEKMIVNMQDIAYCDQIRSPKYLFICPSLRISLKDGTMYEIHNMKDMAEVQRLVLQNKDRKNYEPGSLFQD
ncbi:MAG TPA: hypothetical protein VFC63_28250 [Blastocatellia bacterium]|nr:hypothetical protein [Blastocatellia bacterium]